MVKLHGYSVVLDHRPRHSLRELGKDLEKIRHHHEELKRVKAYERKLYYEHLDLLDHEREAQHNAALDAAAAYYDQVRQEAEEDLRKHLEEERDKETRRRLKYQEEAALYEKKLAERREAQRTQEEEARKRAEKAAEAERAEKAAEAEKARKAAEAEKAKKAAEEEKLKKAAEAEKLKKAAEAEKARKERDRIEEEQRSHQTQNIPEVVIRRVTLIEEPQEQRKRFGIAHLPQSEINAHQRYLQVHQNLKGLRKNLREEGKKNASFRQLIGDMRRSIVKCVGQLREGKNANKNQIQEIRNVLNKGASFSEPFVDVRDFIAFPPESIANSNSENIRASALLIYLLNIFSKAVISQLIAEAGIRVKYAEPIGILAAQVFSSERYIHQGCPMSDILWAKFRVVCPVLWGFYGNESTQAGKTMSGWQRIEPGGPFVKEHTHAERMAGLGAGFAALTLRNFGKTPRQNPFPNVLFWNAMHKILTVPAEEIQVTHVMLLNAMLRTSGERMVGFFGHMGLALLRLAIIEFPNRISKYPTAVSTLKLLRDLYMREKNIIF
ncbi:hypothetical protein V8E54_012275 [Elaphomyces granulatus]